MIVCLFVRVSVVIVCSHVCLFVRLFVRLLVRSFACLFVHSFVRSFICLSAVAVLLAEACLFKSSKTVSTSLPRGNLG